MAVKIAVTPEYEDEKRQFHSSRLLLFLLPKKLTALSDIFFNIWKLCTWLYYLYEVIEHYKAEKEEEEKSIISAHPGIDPSPPVPKSDALTSCANQINRIYMEHNPSTSHIRIRIHSIVSK